MTKAKLARELQAISLEFIDILANEQDAAAKLDRRFAEEQRAVEILLRLVQEAKLGGRWRNTRFNVFDVLGRPRLEEAHSGFLAWLLNPAEAHGFGDAFLREFMRRAVGNGPPSTLDVSVCREYRFRDLRFDIHVEGDQWCLVVENKINDFAWVDQCGEYQEYCKKRKDRGERAWLVYVTPPTRRPSKRTISWLSYREIRLILESLTTDTSAATMIEHFCEHITADLEA
jgi:PD-(D/E)XK nuclease superfamily